jgi:hypothetical protein
MEQHLVQKYTFDVGFDSESKSFEFQNQLAVFIKERIVDLTDTVLTEESLGQDIGVEKLTIDLGNLPHDTFEKDFYLLLKSKLSDKLRLPLTGTGTGLPEEQVEYISKYESNLKILEYFLIHGTLPWSAGKNSQEFSIRKLMEQCLDEDKQKILQCFLALIPDKQVQLRIIRQLDDVLLWKVIEISAGNEIKKVKKFYSDLIKIYKQKPLLKNYLSEFRELIWKFILPQVFTKSTFVYTDKDWVLGFMEFVSKEINMPVEQVVKVFEGSIKPKEKFAGNKDFESSFHAITSEFNKSTKPDSFTKQVFDKNADDKVKFEEFRQEQVRLRINYLVNFLKISLVNFSKQEFVTQREKSELIIKEFAEINPALLRKAFADANFSVNSFSSQQIFQLFTEDVRALLLKEVFKIEKNQFDIIQLETVKRALNAFLEAGYFPYSILPFSFKKAELDKLFTDLFNSDKEEVKKIIKKAMPSLSKKEENIARLKQQLSAKTIRLLFAEFPSAILSKSSEAKSAKNEILKLVQLKSADNIVHLFQYLIKEKSFPSKTNFTVAQLIEKFITDHKEAALVYFATLSDKELKLVQETVLPALAKKMIQRREELAKSVREIKQTIQLNQTDADEETKKTGLAKEKNKTKSPLEEQVRKDAEYTFKKPTEEPIYINNAGLVVFHPYLSRFFNILQLMDKKEFKDEYSAHKAVYLLQYLVNKGLNVEEHELVLNKLLCGIDLHVPLINDIEITDEEKSTCESLIEGVIQNWPILKKTSNDNFRGSFLIREGRLLLNDHQWKLKVEERGYDILVEKIPWALSMIKLPWMKKMLNVEWK